MITYVNGKLTLWKKSSGSLNEMQTIATPALEEKYKIIKSISHVSVSLILILQDIIIHKEKSSQHAKDLGLIADQLERLRKISDEKSQEWAIIEKIADLLDKIVASSTIAQIQCLNARYLLEVAPQQTIFSKATKIQLEGVHKIISSWMIENNIQLPKTRMLISCTKGPKEQLIEKQYLEWLYLQHGISDAEQKNYIICVEMLPEQLANLKSSDLITFLKKYQINVQIGKNILGDDDAMNKDILGKYAPEILSSLCPVLQKTKADTIDSCKHLLFSTSLHNKKENNDAKYQHHPSIL